MISAPRWLLHPQLANDTVTIGDLPLARVLVANDANWPWLILVPRRRDVREIIDLGETDQSQLMAEIAQVSRALKSVTACHKLNIAAIGNIVPQLHVHVVARREGDAGWPKPIWGAAPPRAYREGERERLAEALRETIGLTPPT
jgi:diadenosine tetraphosphate (Ap4A) HIT family hydrolase